MAIREYFLMILSGSLTWYRNYGFFNIWTSRRGSFRLSERVENSPVYIWNQTKFIPAKNVWVFKKFYSANLRCRKLQIHVEDLLNTNYVRNSSTVYRITKKWNGLHSKNSDYWQHFVLWEVTDINCELPLLILFLITGFLIYYFVELILPLTTK